MSGNTRWFGITLVAFLLLSVGRMEALTNGMDRVIWLAMLRARTPELTDAALSITALGSSVLVVIFSILSLLMLWGCRNHLGAFQLLAAVMALDPFITFTKGLFHQARPPEAARLIKVSGFSFPSGHALTAAALYLTIALIGSRHILYKRARYALFAAAGSLILLVGLSRVYLGVHYASDVLGGFALGAAWALALGALFGRRKIAPENAIE